MTWGTPLFSWSRNASTDSYTSGYTFTTVSSPGSAASYYQDGSSGSTAGLKLYSTSTPICSKTPTSVTFTASIGGGSANKNLSNYVYVCFVDKTGAVIDGTETQVTNHITTAGGDEYNISMPTAKATQAYGIFVYHLKESGYNVRYYSFSLSAVVPSKDLIGTFDAIADIELAVGTNQTFNAESYFTLDAGASESATLSVTPEYGSGTHAYFNEGKIYATSYGTEEFTITATPAAADEETYQTATKTFNVRVLKIPTYDDYTNQSIVHTETYTVLDPDDAGDISSITSSNTSVATVAGNVITGVAVGTSTITVNTAKNSEYSAGTTTFVLTVTSPEGTSTKPSPDPITIFNETFAESTGTHSSFSGSDGNGTISYDNDSWSVANAYGAGDCAKFGTGSKKGTATTPAITVENGKNYTLTFKAAPWSAETTGMDVSVTGGNITGISSSDMTTGQWNNYSGTITATSTSLTITISASAEERFFLDDVKVTKPGTDITTIPVTIASSGYGTYCYQYPLNIPDDNEDYKGYYVSNVSGATVTFSPLSGGIKGGVPFILFGNPGTYNVPVADASTTVPAGNQLVGTMAPTYIETVTGDYTNFGLSGGKFVRIANGIIPANKAYLPILTAAIPAHEFSIVFDDVVTGINLTKGEAVNNNQYFNLAGQRVAKPTKGLYIVNGKKIIIK